LAGSPPPHNRRRKVRDERLTTFTPQEIVGSRHLRLVRSAAFTEHRLKVLLRRDRLSATVPAPKKKLQTKKALSILGVLIALALYFGKDILLDPIKDKMTSLESASNTFLIRFDQTDVSTLVGPASPNTGDVKRNFQDRLQVFHLTQEAFQKTEDALLKLNVEIIKDGGPPSAGFDDLLRDDSKLFKDISEQMVTYTKLPTTGIPDPELTPDQISKMQIALDERSRTIGPRLLKLREGAHSVGQEEIESAQKLEEDYNQQYSRANSICRVLTLLAGLISVISIAKFDTEPAKPGE
jgi:hypothetical protein